jgi:hypothetical protein
MNKLVMQQYAEAALELLEDNPLTEGGVVDKSMVGKCASFGPTVIDMGLKPAVMLYSNESSDSGADRRPIVRAIYAILQKTHPERVEGHQDLLAYVRGLQGFELHTAKEEILAACVALKLAMRTFPIRPEEVATE